MLFNTITLVFALALTTVVDASALGAWRNNHGRSLAVDGDILVAAARTRHNIYHSRLRSTRGLSKSRRCKAKVQSNGTINTNSNSGTQDSSNEPKPSPQPQPESKPDPAPAPAPPKSDPKPAPASSSSSGTSSSDINAYLNGHNTVRAAHGASPLTWSDDLAAAAQKWANNCEFKHSGGSLGPYGENLAAGSGDFSIQDGIDAWAKEVSDYDPSNPQPSHFTQMVWKGTSQVGCAKISCNLDIFTSNFWPANFYVCEYSKQGNVIGEFPQNVQK